MTIPAHYLEANRERFKQEVIAGVRQLLRKENRTQAWLAERLGVNRRYIGRLLRGRQEFDMAIISDISLAFGLGVHAFWGKVEPIKARIVKRKGKP